MNNPFHFRSLRIYELNGQSNLPTSALVYYPEEASFVSFLMVQHFILYRNLITYGQWSESLKTLRVSCVSI
jgi:hypothetical protein